jgi:hypothetical protein
MKIILTIIILFSFVLQLCAQKNSSAEKDVSSIDGITSAILESISGKKNEKRDWIRFRNLFWPTAQLNAVFHKGDSSWLKINTIDEFISLAGTWYEDNGFKEYKFKNKIDQFGNIAQVFQSYGATLADGKEIERGVNSYQLAFINNRWWIINVVWDSETDKNKIPKHFLAK